MKKLIPALLALLIIIVIGVGVIHWLDSNRQPAPPPPPGETSAAEQPGQPDWCPTVEILAVPGTWESSPEDDPFNPAFNPNALLLPVTRELQAQHPGTAVKVFTVPYTAQFKNIDSLAEMSYDDSRTEGSNRLTAEILATHRDCPLTDYVLIGFSQGAIIAGDMANTIGTQGIPIPAERIRGVALIADGRREAAIGNHVGTPVGGVGAEISLEPLGDVTKLVMPGATMRGPRPGGFGVLDNKVVEICAPDDHICSAPIDAQDAIFRAKQLIDNSGVHAQYGTNMAVFGTVTTTQWLIDWANQLIGQPPAAPPPPAVTSAPVTSVPPIG
ncbi:cutinase family protein [Corynebacterium choanae]|uniref:Cutinase n=1 Tax=Corynebacterium choanae TaxID=1862358 RepID=A0A3G6J3N6_9CORY|nr:cutinase family protein [Corynebacterium choanae]AZA12552.1 Cutinase [Corynebacterium choanae]